MSLIDPFGLYESCYNWSWGGVSNGVLTLNVYSACYSDSGSAPPGNSPGTPGGNNGAGGGNPGGGNPNNGPTVSHCLWEATKDKGISIGLDIVGAIPVFGNATSATAGIVRVGIAVDHAITKPVVGVASSAYGAYGAVSAGPENPADSAFGAGSAGAGVGLILADATLEGTKAIPLVGNAVSVLTLGWDGYQAYKKYQSCMAGH